MRRCADVTNSNLGGTGVKSGWIIERGYPLCGCCAARSSFAELDAHTALLSNVGQRLQDFYIAAAEQ